MGWIQEDDHVKGGTGWGVELAKFFNREVHVFDQGKNQWFSWSDKKWQASVPTLPEGKFSATGTRSLTPEGEKAIDDLFVRSMED